MDYDAHAKERAVRLDGWGSFFVMPKAASFNAHSFGMKTKIGRV